MSNDDEHGILYTGTTIHMLIWSVWRYGIDKSPLSLRIDLSFLPA
jgi:hypothetical protein